MHPQGNPCSCCKAGEQLSCASRESGFLFSCKSRVKTELSKRKEVRFDSDEELDDEEGAYEAD